MGFNNRGQPAAFDRLQRCANLPGIIGVNIGANKDSADRIADYVAGVRAMSSVADYLTINISSPNTPGLRQLQDEGALRALLSAIGEARDPKGPPIFLKVAPDLGEAEPDQIVRVALHCNVDAIIVANTTVSRPPLKSRYAGEQGGLSGAPLKALALKGLRDFRSASGGEIPLIGVGGIATAEDAWERICAGASLVQLYTRDGLRRPRHRAADRARACGASQAPTDSPAFPTRSGARPPSAAEGSARRLRGAGRRRRRSCRRGSARRSGPNPRPARA